MHLRLAISLERTLRGHTRHSADLALLPREAMSITVARYSHPSQVYKRRCQQARVVSALAPQLRRFLLERVRPYPIRLVNWFMSQPSHHPRTTAPAFPSTMPNSVSSQRENHQQPNKTVLTPAGGHDIPAAINSPGNRQGPGLCAGLKAQEQQVLTCRRPPSTESAG
jgi:hypothetical protein